jgi:outer membrane murein-binding lipoprotein Lpp
MDMTLWPVIGIILLLVVGGLLAIFARDLMWKLTHLELSAGGVKAERTALWDFWSTVSGIIMLIGAGIVTVLVVIGMGDRARLSSEIDEVSALVSERLASDLDEQSDAFIATLPERATADEQRLESGSDDAPGIAADAIRFAVCPNASDVHYVIVEGFRGSARDFVYLTSVTATPETCFGSGAVMPDYAAVYDSQRGGRWFREDAGIGQ